MASPDDRRYLDTHEWHKPTDGVVEVGVSQFAVDELTDVTFVEVAVAEGRIAAGEAFGEIESVKATSDLICGIDGEVVEVNRDVIDNPASINDDAYGAWLIRVKPDDAGQVEGLMSAADYDASQG